ncbi:2-oxoacid:acceptor oxidoreductase subunit alpha [Patescibacteria group bacterium]
MQKIFTVKIAGMAGQGIKSAGIMYARFANRSGLHIYNYIEYPSIIRGGHNVMQINISNEEVTGPSNKTDFLVALNQESIDVHADELTEGAGVVFDGEDNLDVSKLPKGVHLCPVPLSLLAKKAGGGELLVNTVALGALTAHLGGDLEILKNLVKDEYEDKGEEVVAADHKAAELGYEFASENYPNVKNDTLKPVETTSLTKPRMVINGNEAAALGAIAGGVQFAAIYPMSPISNILHVLAKHQETYGYVYKQPEDEISAINMVMGASFAGARSFTATSGGGFALMSEGYGMAGIAELPVVIVEGMRGGPATGIPTWSSQGDLRFVLHAHQDDFPRIILTPGDPEETFYMTAQAMNLAEKYQTPVVVLIDKNVCENDKSVDYLDLSKFELDRGKFTMEKVENFERYNLSPDGISQRSIPGVGNFFIANSDEHDPVGYSSEEIDNRNVQMHKRMTKLETCAKEDMPEPELFGPEDADITLISWGSNKGVLQHAVKEFDNVNFLHLTWVNPFPVEKVTKVLENAKHPILFECNYTSQMGGIIREKTGIEIKDKHLKFDGRPIYIEEVREKINSVLKKGAKA